MIIVSSEDRNTGAVHTHVYDVRTCDNAIVMHENRYPDDYCINADDVAFARGYPEPTVYKHPHAAV